MSVPTDTAHPSTTDTKQAERDAKLQTLRQRLDDAVEALTTGEDWKRAMEFAARFRSRSLNNALLIWSQHLAAYEAGETAAPSPTHVAGFRQWQAMGRHVLKGKRGYQIFAPVTHRLVSTNPTDPSSWHRLGKGAQPAPGEHLRTQMVGSRVVYVWDVSATEGAPLPIEPATAPLLLGEAPAGLWEGIAQQIRARGFLLLAAAGADEIHGANGVTNFSTRTVTVRSDMDDAARCKTLIHELAHCMQESEGTEGITGHRGLAEVQAESVALMVAAAHDLDTSGYTVPYVSTWATTVPGQSPLEVVRSTATQVRTMAITILDALERPQTDTHVGDR